MWKLWNSKLIDTITLYLLEFRPNRWNPFRNIRLYHGHCDLTRGCMHFDNNIILLNFIQSRKEILPRLGNITMNEVSDVTVTIIIGNVCDI